MQPDRPDSQSRPSKKQVAEIDGRRDHLRDFGRVPSSGVAGPGGRLKAQGLASGTRRRHSALSGERDFKRPEIRGWDQQRAPMASLRTRGAMGDFTFTDAEAVRRERRVCREKRISGQIAALAEVEAAKIRGGHVDPREVVGQVQQARPIGEHLSDQNWWPRADGVIREVASRVEARLASAACGLKFDRDIIKPDVATARMHLDFEIRQVAGLRPVATLSRRYAITHDPVNRPISVR